MESRRGGPSDFSAGIDLERRVVGGRSPGAAFSVFRFGLDAFLVAEVLAVGAASAMRSLRAPPEPGAEARLLVLFLCGGLPVVVWTIATIASLRTRLVLEYTAAVLSPPLLVFVAVLAAVPRFRRVGLPLVGGLAVWFLVSDLRLPPKPNARAVATVVRQPAGPADAIPVAPDVLAASFCHYLRTDLRARVRTFPKDEGCGPAQFDHREARLRRGMEGDRLDGAHSADGAVFGQSLADRWPGALEPRGGGTGRRVLARLAAHRGGGADRRVESVGDRPGSRAAPDPRGGRLLRDVDCQSLQAEIRPCVSRSMTANAVEPPNAKGTLEGARDGKFPLRSWWRVAAAVAVLYAVLLPAARALGAYGDDAYYAALARSLARGLGFRSAWISGAPFHVQYPPGLPAVLSPVWLLGGGPAAVAMAARGMDALLVALTAGMLWSTARRRASLGRIAAGLLVLGPLFLDSALQYFGLALAEPWFMALWAVALWQAYAADEDRGAAPLGVAALGFGALFRTQAVVLLPAYALGIWIRTRSGRRALECFAAGLAPVAAWMAASVLRNGSAPGGQSYLSDLLARGGGSVAGLLSNAWFNVKGYTLLFSLYTSFWPLLGVLIVAGFTALAVSGALRLWRGHPELVLTVAANAAVVLLWPYNVDRFVVSALPFVGVLAAAGFESVLEGKGGRVRRIAYAVLALTAVQVAARQVDLRISGERQAESGERPAFWSPSWEVPYFDRFIRRTSAWVESQTPPGARVLTPWPVAIWLHTDRRTFDPEGPADLSSGAEPDAAAVIAGLLVRDTIDVVVVGHPDQRVARGVAGLLERCPFAVHVAGRTPPYGLPAFYLVDPASPCLAHMADAS